MSQLVSILIPCFNAEPWIKKSIESALSQTYPHKEVIVADDGSTDQSLDIIKTFGSLIRYESLPHGGGNKTRNRLLELSRGEWIQYLDADDYLLPDKIEKQVEYLNRDSSMDVLFGPVLVEYGDSGKPEISEIPEPHDPWILLAKWKLPQTGSPLWKKTALIDVGGWKADQPCCQEHELYLRLLMANKRFQYFESSGAVYCWRDSTVSRLDVARTYENRLKIKDRMEAYLKENEILTPLRRQALNQAKLDCARIIWQWDPVHAEQIASSIEKTDYQLIFNNHYSFLYRWMFRTFGFSVAENLARIGRMFPRPRRITHG